MAKPEWGQKRTCPTCAAKFYDLRQETIVCPVCKSAFDPEKLPKPRRGSPVAREDKPAAPAKRAAPIADEEEDDGDDGVATTGNTEKDDSSDDESDTEEGDLIEDASDLGEDEDDIGEVLEHVDEDEEKS